jgi:Flp pilus assembly protein TadG
VGIRDQRGDAATETVLIVPALMLLVLLVVQFGLWYDAQNVARAGAEEGARAARAETGTAAAGRVRAQQFLAQAAGNMIAGQQVTATRGASVATVTVTGEAAGVLPGFRLPVRASVASPLEQFDPPTPP